ncbi:MAG: GNAT family N-acetyltransferase [Acidobacteriota bacterium]|nr:GNAT family N-acetyltransferase [Acidobacteriota bacterium]
MTAADRPTSPEITFRPVGPDDDELLYRIYASTRQEELAPLGWSAEQSEAFLRMQFRAQSVHYSTYYGDSEFLLVLRDGEPAGRLYVHRQGDEIRLIDIALLPEHRNAGIGSRLLRDLLSEAAASGRRVTIHVEQYNPALRLYERLGFRHISDHGVYYLMEWSPATGGD